MTATLCPACGAELVTPERCRVCHTPAAQFAWPRSLPIDVDELEYDLEEVDPRDRVLVTHALDDEGIAYRWQPGPVLVVAETEEPRVDEILEEATSPDVDDVTELEDVDDAEVEADEGAMAALSQLHDAADRLAKHPDSDHAVQELNRTATVVAESKPPWGFDAALWERIGETATELHELVVADDVSLGEIMLAAEELRDMVRDHV